MYLGESTPSASLVSHRAPSASVPIHENPLAERHLRELREGSGLSDQVIAERGYRTVTDPAELRDLGFANAGGWVPPTPGYLLPVYDTRGRNGRYYFKPDHPRQDPDRPERRVKYESQPNRGVVLDVPRRCQKALADWRVPLVITEGPKKSDRLAQLGYCVVDLVGVWAWGWRLWKESGEPLDDWQPILPSLPGRTVYICFDSDAAEKEGVHAAERRLADFLEVHGAHVFVVRLPSEPDGAKNGADDFVVRHGAEAFEQVLRQARPAHDAAELLARVRDLERQISAQAAVLRAPTAVMRPADKLATIAVVNEAGWRDSRGDPAPYRVNLGRLAEATGMSAQSVGSAIRVLSDPDHGVFEKRVTRTVGEDGQWRSAIELAPRQRAGGVVELLQAASAMPAGDRKSWGGSRPRCPDHPYANIKRRTTHTCEECGRLVSKPVETILNCQDDISDDDPDIEEMALAAAGPPELLNEHLDASEKNAASHLEDETSPSPLRTYSDTTDISELPLLPWDSAKADRMLERAHATVEGEYPPDCPLDDERLDALQEAVENSYRSQDLLGLRRTLECWVAAHRQRFAAFRARCAVGVAV
jgi:hypothetical protein